MIIKSVRIFACMLSLSCVLMVGATSCSTKEDYHKSQDDQWLTEQVDKGILTQEQADEIRAKQHNPTK